MSTDLYSQAELAVNYILSRTPLRPRVAIILGTGLGGFASQANGAVTMPYAEIPNFPQSTVEGHSGRLVIGTIGKVPVAVMQGRVHAYEGYAMDQVTFPVRVLGLLGVETLLVTNAAGAINASCGPGAIISISDHINLTGMNSAAGSNEPRFGMRPGAGQRFFDMTNAYSPRLRALAVEEARRQGWTLREGVYLAVLGPSYETAAEIRAFRALGADLVGMSTVHEVIVARHMGVEVLGLSVVTNMAAGVLDHPIQHEEVMETGRRIEGQFASLMTALLPLL
ncbi:MAG: purine-nucleoside phosphorylase [Acidobacteriaceae bacterium]|nr:purine-nucleoside phosphorylase [Acidobacteriaceae bacterium]